MSDNLAYQYEDERPTEIIGGKEVMMAGASINHNYISGNIYRIFSNYLYRKKCIPFGDGTKLFLGKDNQFIPDGMIVCDRSKIKRNWVDGAPDLVVEVLSRSTAVNDRGRKKDAYERAGVKEYWIVNANEMSIEVYIHKEGKFHLDNVYTVCPAEDLEEMTPEERSAVVTHFKCSLFDDLDISLEDIFYRTF